MNHIDKIIERECKGFIGDEPAACYTAKDLRALLQEATEEYRKDGERYRWLREQSGSLQIDGIQIEGQFNPMTGVFDEAIDAAIAAEGK